MEYDDIVSVKHETVFCENTATNTLTQRCSTAPKTEEWAKEEGVYDQLNSSDSKPAVQDCTVRKITYINLALVIVLFMIVIASTAVLIVVFGTPKEQDGGWSSWQNWSSCSDSCGGGIMSRVRTCSSPRPEGTGKQCAGSFEQVSLCNKQPCPETDGGWSSWQNWSSCSDSCGRGIMSRIRTCSNPKQEGTGKQCAGSFEQVSLCNKQPCPETEKLLTFYKLIVDSGRGTCPSSALTELPHFVDCLRNLLKKLLN